ncbi:MAG: hypothetical protein C7B46_06205 [Sulfobacillus benefaciens]|uniref:Alkyl hydroperoxide reductase subunit C/ Thiol specific antioxidant domain-containing protein n=1 Tax=Sulfobacillus benefaciens TaxID=453960 RepID=A0A2T2XIK0_9FIRM|nr:MAG: hypothetical protein C7B46_06205 [Sulfobacillus benefaciens]
MVRLVLKDRQGGPSVTNTTKTLKVGDSAPDFELPTKNQRAIRLSDYLGTNNVLLLFYPLAWTPV